MWIVILDRMKRGLLLTGIFIIFLIILWRPAPEGLSVEAYKTICLFFLCISFWATNLIPLSITSLIAIAGIPLLGVMNASLAYSFFGNKAIFFILGVFILSAAMIGCGLSARMSIWVLDNWGKDPVHLVGGLYLFGLIGSCFMSEHAVAAMLYPIIFEMIHSLDIGKESKIAKSMLFGMAWGCIIGGSATVLGGGRVPLAVEMLEQNTGTTIGLTQYTFLSLPMVIVMGYFGWILLLKFFHPGFGTVTPARAALRKKISNMGRMTLDEKGIGLIMVATLLCWFFFGDELGIANIAIIAIALLFVFNLINWKKVEAHVNWAIILMYGGAICLGKAMEESGAALWLAESVFGDAVQWPGFFLMSAAILSFVLTTFMSNSAVIAILIPPVLGLSASTGINPAVAAMAVILPSNFAFILPIATPASALAYSSKLIALREMIVSGCVLAAIGLSAQAFLIFIYWPLIGFR